MTIALRPEGDFAITFNTENCPNPDKFVAGILNVAYGKAPYPLTSLLLQNPETKEIAEQKIQEHTKFKNKGLIPPSQAVI